MPPQVKKSSVEKYSVRNGYEYATICLDEWRRSEGGAARHGGEILILSSYGTFAHEWTACGEPFKQFLLGVGYHSFMRKCLGKNAEVFDGEATFKAVVKRVLEARRNGDLWKSDARHLYDELQFRQSDLEASAGGFLLNIQLVSSNEAQESLFEDAYDMLREKRNPQAVGFWENLWPVFVEELQRECGLAREGEAVAANELPAPG